MVQNDQFTTAKHFKANISKSKYNHIAMDGGKFQFDDQDALCKTLAKMKATKQQNALVQFSNGNKMLLCFDVDHLHRYAFSEIQAFMKKCVLKTFGSDAAASILITKNRSEDKFHVYFTRVIISKKNYEKITNVINKVFNSNVVDTALVKPKGSVLRYDGFNKYDKEQKMYIEKTDYIILDEDQQRISREFEDELLVVGYIRQAFASSDFEEIEQPPIHVFLPILQSFTVEFTPDFYRQTTTLVSEDIEPTKVRTSIIFSKYKRDFGTNVRKQVSRSLNELRPDLSFDVLEFIDDTDISSVAEAITNVSLVASIQRILKRRLPAFIDNNFGDDIENSEQYVDVWKEDIIKFADLLKTDNIEQIIQKTSHRAESKILNIFNENQKLKDELNVEECLSNWRGMKMRLLSKLRRVVRGVCNIESLRNPNVFGTEETLPSVHSSSNSLDILSDEDEDEEKSESIGSHDFGRSLSMSIVTEQPLLKMMLEKYPIIRSQDLGHCVIFDLDKSEKGRYCVNVNRPHENNNGFLQYDKDSKTLWRKCRKHECANFAHFIWKNVETNECSDVEEEDSFISTTDVSMAKELVVMLRGSWLCKFEDGKMRFYYHSGKYWVPDIENSKLRLFIGSEFVSHLVNKIELAFENGKIKTEASKNKAINAVRRRIENYSKIQSIIKTSADYLRSDVVFDDDPYMFVCPNGTFNFREMTDEEAFGATDPDQNISYSMHADWHWEPEENCQVEIALLLKILRQVLPDEDARHTFLLFASTGLFGAFVKNFLIAHGFSGNNGKSLIATLILYCCGQLDHNYGTVVAESCFTKKDGDRATKAKLDRKRFGVIEEVNKSDTLNGNELKKWTGSINQNCRKFNSNECQIKSFITLMLLMNELCDIYPLDGGVRGRMILSNFPNEFVVDVNKVDESAGIFLQNVDYAGEKWLKKMRCAVFHVLKHYLRKFLNGGKVIKLSKALTNKRDAYMIDCNDFNSWFDDILELTTDPNEGVTLKDLKGILVHSLYFQNLTKKEQRRDVIKRLKGEIRQNMNLLQNYHDGKIVINGVRVPQVLQHYRFKHQSNRDLYSFETKRKVQDQKKLQKKQKKVAGKKRRAMSNDADDLSQSFDSLSCSQKEENENAQTPQRKRRKFA